ncbi:MAG: DUF819 family protein [Fretibacterium sp.]|nr:DUF819 family protein [Fretibacterium sp.]
MDTLIGPDDTWGLWAAVVGWAAVSIWLEQTYRWAARASGVIIALLGAMLLANLGIIPTASPVYDIIWDYVVLLAVPIMLFKVNIKKIWLESGRMFLAFHLSAVGTVLGVALGLWAFARWLPEPRAVAAMITGTYIGGTVNFIAMASQFGASQNVINAAIVADNFNMTLCFFVLLFLPGLAFIRRRYPKRLAAPSSGASTEGGKNLAACWGRSGISLLDIARVMAAGLMLTAVSVRLAGWLGDCSVLPPLLRGLLGSKYLIVTTLSVVCVTLFPRFFEGLHGSQEIGTFLIYLFFVVIGAPASLRAILIESPLLFLFCTLTVLVNIAVTLLLGRLFGLSLEELLIASNAATGGPTTAAAMAASKGWESLVPPAMLVGVWGYAIGSWCAALLAETALPLLG